MRVVLDTNVLVAAFVAHGNCNELLEHCILHHEVVLSEPILDELEDVLARKFGFARTDARVAVNLLKTRTRLVTPVPLPAPVCRDADDDIILATARTADCLAIVTGDKDLTTLGHFGSIRILAPSDFWRFDSQG